VTRREVRDQVPPGHEMPAEPIHQEERRPRRAPLGPAHECRQWQPFGGAHALLAKTLEHGVVLVRES
jgi:hypothetical protein